MKSRNAIIATAIVAILAGAVPILAGASMKPEAVDVEVTKAQLTRAASEFQKTR